MNLPSTSWFSTHWRELVRDITSLGNPALLFLLALLLEPSLWLHTLIGLAVVESTGRMLKVVLFRPRPHPLAYASSWLEKTDAGSFPSLHAARSAFVFGLLALAADSTAARTTLTLLPGLVGATRVVLGLHRTGDVIAGLALGAGIALLSMLERHGT